MKPSIIFLKEKGFVSSVSYVEGQSIVNFFKVIGFVLNFK